jgi:long-chain acyl-CoA synthetase
MFIRGSIQFGIIVILGIPNGKYPPIKMTLNPIGPRRPIKTILTAKHSMSELEIKTEEKAPIETAPIRHPLFKNKDLLESPYKDVLTVDGLFFHSASQFPDKQCMGKRRLAKMHKKETVEGGKTKVWLTPEFAENQWWTYKQVEKIVVNFGDGVMNFIKSKGGDNIGIYEETRAEWMQSFFGCIRHSLVVATCYSNLGIDALVHVINETELTCLICNGSSIKILDSLKDQCPTLKYLIYLDELSEKSKHYECMSFDEVCKLGETTPVKVETPSQKEALCCLMYTSGSTGAPKGVMIQHRNIVAFVASAQVYLTVSPGDVYLGYLPLAHILELAAECTFYSMGGAIGYGTPRTLTDKGCKPIGDLQAWSPTHMAGVPRVWETIRKGALEKIHASGWLKQYLFETAFAAKCAQIKVGGDTPWWNSLVFDKFKEMLGGRMKAMISGGAPLTAQCQEFIRVCFSAPIIQGYGLTETVGGACIQEVAMNKFVTGQVGFVLPSSEVKLVSVPDMGYNAEDKPCPRGEILIKGHNVTLGYYKNEQKTSEDFKDGWFLTGDIGRLNENGTVSIIDRKKNLVKMAHGEYVALENLESIFGSSPFVSPNGLCLYGDSHEDHVVGVVIPQKTYVLTWAKENGITEDDYGKILAMPKVKAAIAQTFKDLGAQHKKKSFEMVADFCVYDEEWTPENEKLTAAMKLKRENIIKAYKSDIDAMYKKLKK